MSTTSPIIQVAKQKTSPVTPTRRLAWPWRVYLAGISGFATFAYDAPESLSLKSAGVNRLNSFNLRVYARSALALRMIRYYSQTFSFLVKVKVDDPTD
jgi:hypothetical protein